MNLRHVPLIAAALGAATLPTSPAVAAPTADASCHASYDIDIEPGLSADPAHATGWTPEPGAIHCDGPVLGKAVKGAGHILNITRVGVRDTADCIHGGDGVGTVEIDLPGADGSHVKLFDAGEYTFGGLKHGLLSGSFDWQHITGTFTALPLTGNCLTTPITRARITLDMTARR